MKIYSSTNVYEAAKERYRYLFDEFDDIVVGFSGGKDSTVVLNLAIEIAKEKNKLPVKVLFLDQEGEWGSVIEYIRYTMNREEVEPMWFQIPFIIFNATSHDEHWLKCWEEGAEWIREKEPNSYKINKYNTERFAELFTKIFEVEFANSKACYLSGVRAEESPTRLMALTDGVTYKWITWGKKLNKELGHYTFYPIYDWSYTDVWKAIHDNDWKYTKIYDDYYKYGIPVKKMRVSNLNHETAVASLNMLQEIDKDTWNSLTKRLKGIKSAGQLKDKAFIVKEVPYMFSGWKEYRNYLLDALITNKEHHAIFSKCIDRCDKLYTGKSINEKFCKRMVTAILLNDYHLTTIVNFEHIPAIGSYRQYKTGLRTKVEKINRYLEEEYGLIIYTAKKTT